MTTRPPSLFYHLVWVLLFLACLGYSWLSGTFENVVFWPASYFLALWLMSGFIPVAFSKIRLNRRGIMINVLLSFVFGWAHFLFESFLILILERLFGYNEHFTLAQLPRSWIGNWYQFLPRILWYWAYLAFLIGYRLWYLYQFEKENSKTREADLGSERIEKMSLQLQPHFLFNSMNSIAMMIRRGETKAAVTMIAELNMLLREILYSDPTIMWPVKEEIALPILNSKIM